MRRYGFGAQACFFEGFNLRMPDFLVLPGLFVVQVIAHITVHHAVVRVFPMEMDITAL